jgi:hypothetical protein
MGCPMNFLIVPRNNVKEPYKDMTDELIKVLSALFATVSHEIKAMTPFLVWAYIDDFLIHGPTYEKTSRAMQALMHKALDIGLLLNPTMITPSTSAVNDTKHIPSLRIPTDKRLLSFSSTSWTVRVKRCRDWHPPFSTVFSRL